MEPAVGMQELLIVPRFASLKGNRWEDRWLNLTLQTEAGLEEQKVFLAMYELDVH